MLVGGLIGILGWRNVDIDENLYGLNVVCDLNRRRLSATEGIYFLLQNIDVWTGYIVQPQYAR